MKTIEAIEEAKNCYRVSKKCCGDSGEVKCFFCPACVYLILRSTQRSD